MHHSVWVLFTLFHFLVLWSPPTSTERLPTSHTAFSPLWWRCLGPGCRGAPHDWLPAAQGWGRAALHSCCCQCGLSLILLPSWSGDGTGGSQLDSCPSPRSGSPHHSLCHQSTAESSAGLTGSWWREPILAHAAHLRQPPDLLPLKGVGRKEKKDMGGAEINKVSNANYWHACREGGKPPFSLLHFDKL